MSKLEQSSAARNMMAEDFFGGWETADIDLFRRFAAEAEPIPGKITDFMGLRTSSAFHPWAAHLDNTVLPDLPLPDDSLRAEAIEYFALFDALERSSDSFAMAEIGSSYGPWTCAAAVCARRMGKTFRLSAVEASSYLFGLIPQHLAENGVDPSSVRLINGAAATERTRLYFPKVTSPGDNGGQASSANGSTDYLNRAVENEAVEAYPLEDLMPDGGVVDLIHIDVQGHEFNILSSAIEFLNRRLKSIFIGTHSRKIEGQLLELFHSEKWELVRERPTRFSYSAAHDDVVAWTTRDGGQYWRNPSR